MGAGEREVKKREKHGYRKKWVKKGKKGLRGEKALRGRKEKRM